MHPVDSWFFREAVPFDAGGSYQLDVGGLFPPAPSTVCGALRAELARSQGWNGQGRWPVALNAALGDGPDNIGKLDISGPFVLHHDEALFPVPRHVVGKVTPGGKGWVPSLAVLPGQGVRCDLGEEALLPTVARDEDVEPADGWWLTSAGLDTVLHGRLPNEGNVRARHELWSTEPRIGLARDAQTRAAKKGMLYAAVHVRPQRQVSLGVLIDGLPSGWDIDPGRLVPLGGEGRLAECQRWAGWCPPAASIDEISSSGRFVLVALTPADIDPAVRQLDLFGGATVVSACLGRPQRVGGWTSVGTAASGGGQGPVVMRSVVPAGSTFFCEASDRDRLGDELGRLHGRVVEIGRRTSMGFGMTALGVWPGG